MDNLLSVRIAVQILCKASVRNMRRGYGKLRHGSSFRKPEELRAQACLKWKYITIRVAGQLLIYCNKVCMILASHMRHGLNSRNLVKCTVPLKFESISPAQIEIIASRFPWSSANHFWPGVAINDVLFTQREAAGWELSVLAFLVIGYIETRIQLYEVADSNVFYIYNLWKSPDTQEGRVTTFSQAIT